MKDKIIWITGASSGIGEALVYLLHEQGAKLIISSRNRDALYRVKQNCKNNSIDIHVLPLDLEQTEILPEKAALALKIFGRIDILIHSAGISQRALAINTGLKVAQQLMDVNFWGAVSLTQGLLPSMISAGGGQIVVVSSLVGKFGTRLRSAYSASKHALHGYFDSLRIETEEHNIHITIVCPGFIKTNLTFNALLADGSAQNTMDDAQENGMMPDECASKIIKAVASKKREVYIGGREKYAVLIKRFFPGYFAKMIRKAKVV
ncbi:SDR family oxidoreductase [Daejeonella oryzae]|uniref:SDR family oxidoreductase n=1 Tax=Daejeonella oryzae TaxID=1122943 RepID=UPI00040A04F5|nr:SDR family oxidoreductase [Daejeonella oryzae]